MGDLSTGKQKKYGKKIQVSAYIAPEIYDKLSGHADARDEDRWESPLLRRIIIEWLEIQEAKVQTPGGELQSILSFLAARGRALGAELVEPEDQPAPKASPRHKGNPGKE